MRVQGTRSLKIQELLQNIKSNLHELEVLLAENSSHLGYEDPIYRFYHQGWDVYSLQNQTTAIVRVLEKISPTKALNGWFMQIVCEGTGKKFTAKHNQQWLSTTRPILEAFFHAKYFLEMAVKYGRELQANPPTLPSGWAALLSLYNLR